MGTRSTHHRRQQTLYLIFYNLISAILWSAVLGRVLLLIPLVGFENVSGGVGEFAKWTQTLALLEVVHSAIGLVRSPIRTTALQVSSRLVLIWPVVHRYPEATAPSMLYSSMLLAWSITEVIRYSYFFVHLQGSGLPDWLTWLRYHTFYVLYPVGIASEWLLVWKASGAAEGAERVWWWIALGAYLPGSYVLFTHMMAQRRRVLRGKGVERRY